MYSATNSFLNKRFIKPILMSMVFVICFTSSLSNAANNAYSNDQPLDISSMEITTHELALMQVLSEICPNLLVQNQKQAFQSAYNSKLRELMPNVSNPQNAMRYLSSQKDYRDLHDSMKKWTLGFSKAENRALCEDIAEFKF